MDEEKEDEDEVRIVKRRRLKDSRASRASRAILDDDDDDNDEDSVDSMAPTEIMEDQEDQEDQEKEEKPQRNRKRKKCQIDLLEEEEQEGELKKLKKLKTLRAHHDDDDDDEEEEPFKELEESEKGDKEEKIEIEIESEREREREKKEDEDEDEDEVLEGEENEEGKEGKEEEENWEEFLRVRELPKTTAWCVTWLDIGQFQEFLHLVSLEEANLQIRPAERTVQVANLDEGQVKAVNVRITPLAVHGPGRHHQVQVHLGSLKKLCRATEAGCEVLFFGTSDDHRVHLMDTNEGLVLSMLTSSPKLENCLVVEYERPYSVTCDLRTLKRWKEKLKELELKHLRMRILHDHDGAGVYFLLQFRGARGLGGEFLYMCPEGQASRELTLWTAEKAAQKVRHAREVCQALVTTQDLWTTIDALKRNKPIQLLFKPGPNPVYAKIEHDELSAVIVLGFEKEEGQGNDSDIVGDAQRLTITGRCASFDEDPANA